MKRDRADVILAAALAGLASIVLLSAVIAVLYFGRALLVPGWRNRLTARAVTLLPRRAILHAAERATRRIVTT